MFDQALLDQLSKLSYLEPDVLALTLILGLDLLLTLVHSLQEFNGRLWRYFGAIAGVRIRDDIGFLVFSLILTSVLWLVGFAGIAGYLPIVGKVSPYFAIMAVGGLIGGRLSDRWFSHVRLERHGYKPNPGLTSTPYYLAEAIILAVIFLPGLRDNFMPAAIGFIAGGLFFYSVLPILRVLSQRAAIPRTPWSPGDAIPE